MTHGQEKTRFDPARKQLIEPQPDLAREYQAIIRLRRVFAVLKGAVTCSIAKELEKR